MKRKQFGYRTFGGVVHGVRYRFSRDFDTKREAQSYAAFLRKQGKKARVTKAKILGAKVYYYIVWVNK